MSLEFEDLHQKSQCEMPMTLVMTSLLLARVFHCLFAFALISALR